MPRNSEKPRAIICARICRLIAFLLFILAPSLASAKAEGMVGWLHEVNLEVKYSDDPLKACRAYDGPYGRTFVGMEPHVGQDGLWNGTAYRCNLVHLEVPGQPTLYRLTDLICEAGYYKSWPGVCIKGPNLPDPPPSSCTTKPGTIVGNPVFVADGVKYQEELDLRAGPNGALDIVRYYRSKSYAPQPGQRFSPWKFSFEVELRVPTVQGKGMPTPVTVIYPDQSVREFKWVVDRYQRGDNPAESLTRSAEGDEWMYKSAAGRLDRFQKIRGRYLLVSSHSKEGVGTYIDYPDTMHLRIRDDHDRGLIATIEAQVIKSIEGVNLSKWYSHEFLDMPHFRASRLLGAAFVDENKNAVGGRYYEYMAEDVSLASQFLLTAIVDENGARFAKYAYDDSARVVSSEHAGGADRHIFSYPSDSVRVVKDPLGTERQYSISINGSRRLISTISQPGGAGCAPAAKSFTYQSGEVSSIVNFNGRKTCMWNSGPRNLESVRVEGKTELDGCGNSQSPLGEGERKISTQWHPDWSVKTGVAEPLKRTNYIFNGQTDREGKLVECAEGGKLPNGQPIAVLCRKIEQATIDASGAQGFNATATGAPRVTSYTYNKLGQIISETVFGRAGSDGDTWRYLYYAATSAGHTSGDLWKEINPKGQVTEFLEYTPTGLPTRVKAHSGEIKVFAYDVRGQETLRIDGAGSTAEFRTNTEYDLVGQVTRVTRSDETSLSYEYDDAHRLVDVRDGAGNRIHFSLDGMGNRISEEVGDVGGKLVRRTTRTYDSLNRLKEQIGGNF